MQTAEGCRYLPWFLFYYLHSCFISMFLILQNESFQDVKVLRMSWWVLDLSSLDHDLAPSCKVTVTPVPCHYLVCLPTECLKSDALLLLQLLLLIHIVYSCQIAFSLLHMICYGGCFCCHHLPSLEFFPLFTTPLPIIHLFTLQLQILAKVVLSSKFCLEGCLADTPLNYFQKLHLHFYDLLMTFLEPALCVSPLQLSNIHMFHCKAGL